MNLSSDLISQLVEATSGSKETKKTDTGATVYGTAVVNEDDGRTYVQIDGSEQLTPVTPNGSAAVVESGERVSVLIKDHRATIMGNLSSPAPRKETVDNIGDQVTMFDIAIGDLVKADLILTEYIDAEKAKVEELYAAVGSIDELIAENLTVTEMLTANEAAIESLSTNKLDATIAEITYAAISDLDVTNAVIYNLQSVYGSFEQLTATKLDAVDAYIANLEVDKLSAVEAELTYANIEFANIGEAAIRNFFAKSGMIDDLVISNGQVTGHLVGVTIKGDLIEAGTLMADRLLVKGEGGLYYQLNVTENGDTTVTDKYTDEELQNGLLGDIIVAKSITAGKVAVDDLVAFDATIAGFHITGDELDEHDNIVKYGAIYSGVKESVDNATRGIYMDNEGQMALGDSDTYLRYRKDENGKWKLEIALGSSGKTINEDIDDVKESVSNIKVGARNLLRNSKTLLLETYYFYEAQAGDGEDTPATLGMARLGDMMLGLDETGNAGETIAVVEETLPETTPRSMTQPTMVAEIGTSKDYTHQGFVDGMILHDYHLINMENAIIKALAGVATARITTISLPAANWSGSGTIYSQAVLVDGVAANSKIDLLPSPEQLNELLLAEISLTAANSNGSITVFALGAAPSSDIELQAMITEVIIPEVSL